MTPSDLWRRQWMASVLTRHVVIGDAADGTFWYVVSALATFLLLWRLAEVGDDGLRLVVAVDAF